jgi:hypothetical protein
MVNSKLRKAKGEKIAKNQKLTVSSHLLTIQGRFTPPPETQFTIYRSYQRVKERSLSKPPEVAKPERRHEREPFSQLGAAPRVLDWGS